MEIEIVPTSVDSSEEEMCMQSAFYTLCKIASACILAIQTNPGTLIILLSELSYVKAKKTLSFLIPTSSKKFFLFS